MLNNDNVNINTTYFHEIFIIVIKFRFGIKIYCWILNNFLWKGRYSIKSLLRRDRLRHLSQIICKPQKVPNVCVCKLSVSLTVDSILVGGQTILVRAIDIWESIKDCNCLLVRPELEYFNQNRTLWFYSLIAR